MSRDSKRAVFEDDRGDRISSLPSNVIDCILEFLPVQDAARTSILSKKWRYIWAMLPNLKLDNLFCNKLASRSQYVFEQTIDKTLLQHIGDIVKFDLDLSGVELTPCPDIDRWIFYATKNGVKKLKLKMTKDGLTTLHLERITFEPATEFCVINTPLVFKLILLYCKGTQYLDIVVSTRLEYLSLRESHDNLNLKCFMNCKRLKGLYLWVYNDKDETVMKYLDKPACLDRSLNKLEDAVMHSFRGSKSELMFIKLLFACAPSLVRMNIKLSKGAKEERHITKELMRFPRASPKAELFYSTNAY